MSVFTDGTTYTQTTVSAPTEPSTTAIMDITTTAPLIREIVANGTIDEPALSQDITSARSFFTGNTVVKADTILSNLKLGQQYRLDIEKAQNPLSLYKTSAVEYQAVDSCHDQIVRECSVPCLSTAPEFEHIIFRFDTEYVYGVRACAKDRDLWQFDYFTKQYALSRAGEQFGREVDLWNTVIKGLIASPATTVDAFTATCHATHFWEEGDVASDYKEVAKAYQYMVNAYAEINPTIFITQEFATAVISAVEVANPFAINMNIASVDTFKKWDVPGFNIADAVKTVLGLGSAPVNVVVMKRSPWLVTSQDGTLVSQYPLWNSDGTKQYVAILDPRVGYQIARAGFSLNINPYDCDKLVMGMIDTEMVGSGITFSQYGLVLQFDAATC